MDPEMAGLGLNLAAEGRFKAGEAASILGTTSAVMSNGKLGVPGLLMKNPMNESEKSEKMSNKPTTPSTQLLCLKHNEELLR